MISFDENDQRLQILRDTSLLVEGDSVTQLREGPLLHNLPSNVTRINATDKIIGPGYIDTHHHLWQTAFRTIASNSTLP